MAPPDAKPAARVLGLTGAIGCGKTTVGDILLELGARERIDADRVVRALMVPGSPVTREIAAAFGNEVLDAAGGVNRARLAEIVFADQERLRSLEAIVHPAVRRQVRDRLAALQDRPGVVVVDAIRLLQSELLWLCDAVWAVRCDPESQRERLTRQRGMTEQQVDARLAAQPSFQHPRVTAVIDNSGSLDDLRRDLAARWQAQLQEWGLSPPTPSPSVPPTG